jgi:hypothetical protein
LPPAAAEVQKLRDIDFKRAYSYMQLVEALKDRKILSAIGIATGDPIAALNLWRPVKVRLQRAAGLPLGH